MITHLYEDNDKSLALVPENLLEEQIIEDLKEIIWHRKSDFLEFIAVLDDFKNHKNGS